MAVRSFGPFVFDTATGSLTKHGASVRLQPQPARVLSLLVERAGQLVTRDELQQAVWSEGTHVDFERGLNFCISQIRFALGDSADTPRYIETEPKRGYRFIGVVPRAAVADPGPVPEPAPARWSPRALAIAAALLIAAGLVSAIAALSHDSRVRLAVFPFDNETADSAYEGIAGGIADETVSRLSTPARLAEFRHDRQRRRRISERAAGGRRSRRAPRRVCLRQRRARPVHGHPPCALRSAAHARGRVGAAPRAPRPARLPHRRRARGAHHVRGGHAGARAVGRRRRHLAGGHAHVSVCAGMPGSERIPACRSSPRSRSSSSPSLRPPPAHRLNPPPRARLPP